MQHSNRPCWDLLSIMPLNHVPAGSMNYSVTTAVGPLVSGTCPRTSSSRAPASPTTLLVWPEGASTSTCATERRFQMSPCLEMLQFSFRWDSYIHSYVYYVHIFASNSSCASTKTGQGVEAFHCFINTVATTSLWVWIQFHLISIPCSEKLFASDITGGGYQPEPDGIADYYWFEYHRKLCEIWGCSLWWNVSSLLLSHAYDMFILNIVNVRNL